MIPPLLHPILRAADRRLRLQASARLLFVTLSSGLLFTLLLSLVTRIYPLTWPARLLLLGLGLTAGGIIITQLYAWLRPQSPLAAARLLDRRLRLDERLSTALELAQQPGHTPPSLVQAQLADTAAQLRRFDAARVLPLPSPWRWLGLICFLVLALGVNLFISNPQLDLLEQQAEAEKAIAEQKARFEEVRAELLEDKPLLETPSGRELLQTLDELIKELEENNNREEAMAAISRGEQKLAQLRDSQDEQPVNLNDLAQTLSQFESTEALAEALAQRDLGKAAEALASAGRQAAANPAEAQNLANALRQAAQTAEAAGNSDLASTLNRAAEAIEQAAGQSGQNGTAQMSEEALRQAADALAKAGQQQAGQETLEQALANIQKAREQLAQAGGQEQAKEAGQGQGAGSQTEPSQGTGGGSGREDPGPGAEGLTAEQGTSNEMSTDNGPNEGRTREYESLYAPLHLGGEGGPIVKPEEQEATGGLPIGDAPVDPNQDPGTALVPYNQVYGEYTRAAGQALDESYIPLGMKGYIRQYFGALEPERR